MNIKNAEIVFEELVKELELSGSAYDVAVNRYEDIGRWFSREDSSLRIYDPHIFSQGSFRLGTAIKSTEYDLDLTCEFKRGISKENHSQYSLRHLVQQELEFYRQARGIQESIIEKRRCWRLLYQDQLHFHIDIVPCIPESDSKRKMIFDSLIYSGQEEILSRGISDLTVAITDNQSRGYMNITDEWNISNPEGYAKWFEGRMMQSLKLDVFGQKNVDEVPLFKRKSSLQRSIQLLKKHRDIMFLNHEDSKPISIIITTLAARAYSGESGIYETTVNILEKMESLINITSPKVPNPVDPQEDFADKWGMPKYRNLELENNFKLWLRQVRSDFHAIGTNTDPEFIKELVRQKFNLKINIPGFTTSSPPRSPKKYSISNQNQNKPWALK